MFVGQAPSSASFREQALARGLTRLDVRVGAPGCGAG
jgi:hypothetical protein